MFVRFVGCGLSYECLARAFLLLCYGIISPSVDCNVVRLSDKCVNSIRCASVRH